MISLGFCNNITSTIINTKIDFYINKYSKKYQLEPAFVKAFCRQESRLKPYCIRYEKHLHTNKSYCGLMTEKEKRDKLSYCSLGLMQILFGTAKERGFKGTPEDLLKIENSLEYGIRHLKWLIRRFWELKDVISAYNQGSPRKKNGKYCNQSYVDNVLKYYNLYSIPK